MIFREATEKLQKLAAVFKAVAVTGPRQSGKTTLVKTVFRDKPYISLENPDTRNFAMQDPRAFLANYPQGAILDEAQRVPELFSYLQEILDNSKKRGLFILTGSNNFLLQENISQTLAGRVAYLNLLPLSIGELRAAKKLPAEDDDLLLKGFYPAVYSQRIPFGDWCQNYIRTYIERDVRQVKNITEIHIFEKFMRLLAGRCGQELNMSSIAVEAGVDIKTIQSWIGVLENSFIIFQLRPHFRNFNKTVVKRPKIYFYDTALACSLLRISDRKHLHSHPLRGAIFETFIVSEFVKKRSNRALPINLSFWRDKTGHEIDLIMDVGGKLTPIEIKSGKTVSSEFFKNLIYWKELSSVKKSLLIYAGKEMQTRSDGTRVIPWRMLIELKDSEW